MAPTSWRPTREQLAGAQGKTISDLIAPGLRVLFVGINPGLYSAAVGHHFARPGNRFWPVLHASGFTPRLLSPFEERELLKLGLGITNVVARTTATAAELATEELKQGVDVLAGKVRRYQPRVVAFLGLDSYRKGLGRPRAAIGLQEETISGSALWLLPNPSGLNAHFQIPELAALYRELNLHVSV
ncbi:MAG: double-stranded uracil-DNA glycosylase [Actinomycetota bacterium]|jgi:TDG/mug DNA glycosylase family protein|nr:double-stranded uracil-DNA glycosylase [Actinomycetota bacterium]